MNSGRETERSGARVKRKLSLRDSYARRHPGKFSTLRKVSKKKADWNRQYAAAKAARLEKQIAELGCYQCEKCKRIAGVNGPPPDGHHPEGQAGKNILNFHLLCRICHTWCHEHADDARNEGWTK